MTIYGLLVQNLGEDRNVVGRREGERIEEDAGVEIYRSRQQ